MKRPKDTSYTLKAIDRKLWNKVKILALKMNKSIGECVLAVLEEKVKKEQL